MVIYGRSEIKTPNISGGEREIMERKFRGKDKKTGEWCYGYYARMDTADDEPAKHYIVTATDKPLSSGNRMESWKHHEVIPETVGQSTGAPDEKGVEIYEGDRVLVPSGVETVCRWSYHCGFSLFGKETHQTYAVRFKDSSSGVSCKPLVIGTIHDSFEAIAAGREGE